MYKTLPKTDLPGLIEKWLEHATVYAPVRQGDFAQFQPLSDPAQADLDFAINTRYPPKSLFLPQSEVMFRVKDGGFESTEDDEVSSRVILGMRACDARALQLLDGVFLAEDYQDPYWAKKREQTTLVVLGCADPCETCFCTTVGTGPFDERGADVVLTEVGDSYVAEVCTPKGQDLFDCLPDASRAQVKAALKVQSAAKDKMHKPFEPEGVQDKLYGLFKSDFWLGVQESCLGCGVCTFLCPTCYCFDIVDEALRNERVRNWDTCMFRIYSQEASGHNPRPTKTERTRQRVMHKYAYFVELYKEIGCTGCGRCVRYCPVNLDIRQIIRSAQAWEES
jgi:sulfhydrogenase subunit beta (sulfur reductase)